MIDRAVLMEPPPLKLDCMVCIQRAYIYKKNEALIYPKASFSSSH